MHPILHSRIGADQFATRLLRLRDDARFREVGPDVLELAAEEEAAVGTEGAPTGLWFDWPFVAFWKNNFGAHAKLHGSG